MLIGWAVLVVLALFAARSLEWGRVLAAMRTANPLWLVVAVAANAAIVVFWSGFWRVLLPRGENVSFSRMFTISAIASAVMNTVPFLAGHATSILLLVRRGGMTRHGALSVLALDQLGEGLAKVIVFMLAGALTPIPTAMRAGIITASSVVVVLLVVLLVVAHRYPDRPGDHSAHSSMADRARAFVARWAHALDTLRSPRRSAAALASVLAIKAAELIGIVAVQRAFGVDVPVAAPLLVLAAIMLATMIPLAPGNVGAYEASVWFAYGYFGVPSETALALALVQHACFMIPAVGIGYLLLVFDTRSAIASE
jgi:uncharacterized protein (TIRG00374 family)